MSTAALAQTLLAARDRANKLEYYSKNLVVNKMGLVEKVVRTCLSFFSKYFDSPKTACLRASVIVIHDQVHSSERKVHSKVKEIFNNCLPKIPTWSESKLENWVDHVNNKIADTTAGGRSLREDVPKAVWETLETLFENSPYYLWRLPLYAHGMVKEIELDKMTAPVMTGSVGTKSPHPFIAIKVERVVEPSDQPPLQALITLSQYYSSGPDHYGQGRNENAWYGNLGQASFFSSAFTYIDTGEGPTDSQKENFVNFQQFLEKGEGTDLAGVKWRIVSS